MFSEFPGRGSSLSTKMTSLLDRLKGKKSKKAPEPTEPSSIGTPFAFKHNIHVGFDSGGFVGLPESWNRWLEVSNIR